jgi:hypothetical protein
MAKKSATYKVGDTYTSQKSKVTGVIKEIVPNANGTVRVKLRCRMAKHAGQLGRRKPILYLLSMRRLNCSLDFST